MRRIGQPLLSMAGIILAAAWGAESTRAADPVIDPDVSPFAHQIETSMKGGDISVLGAAIDMRNIARIAVAGIPAPQAERVEAIDAIASGDGGKDFAATIVKPNFDLRMIHVVNGQTRMLFRMASADVGVNYYDMVVQRRPDRSLSIADIYVMTTGEMISQTMRVPYALKIAEETRNTAFLSRVLGGDNSISDGLTKLADINRMYDAKQYKQVLDAIYALPESVQRIKLLLMIRFQSAEHLYSPSSPQVNAVTDEIRAALPNDPCVDFISLDCYDNRKQYDKADEELVKIAAFSGGNDGWIDLLRAVLQTQMGHADQARAMVDQAIADEPRLQNAYSKRLDMALNDKDNATVVKMLAALEQKFSVHWKDLKTVGIYGDFVKSPEYAAWAQNEPDQQTQPAAPGNNADAPAN